MRKPYKKQKFDYRLKMQTVDCSPWLTAIIMNTKYKSSLHDHNTNTQNKLFINIYYVYIYYYIYLWAIIYNHLSLS